MSVKIAFIGAGSYTFGPSMLKQALVEHRMSDIEFALMDLDRSVVELMGAVGRQTAKSLGLTPKITTTTDRAEALAGADFVLFSAAIQGARRFNMDCEIIQRHALGNITEMGGVQGISYSLRQIALIQSVAADMRRLCPDAWLLSSANPLPRVCQAAHESGVKVAGFCSVSSVVYLLAWRLLYGESIDYPWERGIAKWSVKMAGLNHFAWLLEMKDKATGEDITALLKQAVESGKTAGNPICERLFLKTGYMPLPADDHCRDFLPPQPEAADADPTPPFHGSADERQERLALLAKIAAGEASLADVPGESWERPMDFIAAMTTGKAASFSSLNLINAGQMPDLPANVFVETPVTVSAGGPVPAKVQLPQPILPYCRQTAAVTDAIVRAATQQKIELVHEAVQLDPSIADKQAAVAAIDECLQAHRDVLPKYT